MDTRISGKTRLLGVFGTPIKHSGSPIMYNFCFDYYGIDCAYPVSYTHLTLPTNREV